MTALNLKALNNGEDLGSCIVTPNYDDYIFEELVDADRTRAQARRGSRSAPQLLFPTEGEPLETGRGRKRLNPWVKDADFPRPSTTACIHLHGFIPRNANGRLATQYRHPVVSEQDYFDTESASFETLRALMNKSALLIVDGGKTAREVVEQLTLDAEGGVGNLNVLNKVNPIGASRIPLHMPLGYTR